MADYYMQDKTEELNKRMDDAFMELDAQRSRMSGLTRENSELKQEIEKLESRINKTDKFVDYVVMVYLFTVVAKLLIAI